MQNKINKEKIKRFFYQPKTSEIRGTIVQHRSIPLISIFIVVIVLSILMFVIGLMIGYGVLHSPLEIFNPKTWQHAMELTGSKK
ncbi:DNA-directed RNA polymerase subunit beta [Macrococcus sp. DPC7161]|uniref:DNA-directed RNA polymerase subunit beta n=1 Tax=Macrococcus sp. DPC7161 TaxID=2507060 RepID=UPI00100C2224|nr:DNA-directed RNA polymerase subunit beta [Macrococcus sp. DPC7161]RXK17550.1 DNA-directed RNA polymerase subunit beta [Macrococcus sp. DPC7161]